MHDSRYIRREISLPLGSNISSSCFAYMLWLAVKITTSNISDTLSKNVQRLGLFFTYTVCSFILKKTVKVKSASSQWSRVEWTSVSAQKQACVVRMNWIYCCKYFRNDHLGNIKNQIVMNESPSPRVIQRRQVKLCDFWMTTPTSHQV